MPSPGVRANIYRGFILYSLLIHSMILHNLRSLVNQENLSVLAATLCEQMYDKRFVKDSQVC